MENFCCRAQRLDGQGAVEGYIYEHKPPTLSTVFADVPDGQKVKMYTITENGHPIHPNEMFKNATNLTVTDRYFGDEYLVQWVISNGVAVASKPLLKNL